MSKIILITHQKGVKHDKNAQKQIDNLTKEILIKLI